MTEITELSDEMSYLKNEIIDFIANENRAFFKSQQIDDDELTVNDRKKILNEILLKSHLTFLSRFGPYLKREHIKYFEQHNQSLEGNYEIDFYLNQIKKGNSSKSIKNRRYEAMKKMIKDGSYFGEVEMMIREPFLYEQLVGQYLTVNERHARDRLQEDAPFSQVLLAGIEKDQIEELRKKQESELLMVDDDDTQEAVQFNENQDDQFPSVPSSFKQQWGEFEDDKAPTMPHKVKPDYCNLAEKELLREEFIGIMYSKFLSGSDKEFDYKSVDNNDEYDNLTEISQDEESKYFDSEEIEDDDKTPENNVVKAGDESEDELDVYMRHLNDELPI